MNLVWTDLGLVVHPGDIVSITPGNSRAILAKYRKAGLAAIARLAMQDIDLNSTSENSPEIPWPPTDQQFDWYLKFLTDKADLPKRVTDIIDRTRRLVGVEQLQSWQDYIRTINQIERELSREQRRSTLTNLVWQKGIPAAAGGATVKAISLALGDIQVDSIIETIGLTSISVLGVGTTAILVGKAGNKVVELSAQKTKQDPKMQLLTRWNELNELKI